MAGASFQALLSSGGVSAIGTPVSLGSIVGTAAASSCTIVTTAAVPAGALLFLVTQFNKGTTISVSSVSDGTNNYTLAKSAGWNATNFDNQELWYCANAAAVGSGASLVVTYSSTLAVGVTPIAAAGYCTGILAASPLDSTNSAKYESGTAYSSGATATLAQAKELIIGALGFYSAACTVTEGSGFTQLVDQDQGSGNRSRVHLAYQIVNATTAINYQPTLSVANFGGSMIASFKGA
jgi:hypothetical protein